MWKKGDIIWYNFDACAGSPGSNILGTPEFLIEVLKNVEFVKPAQGHKEFMHSYPLGEDGYTTYFALSAPDCQKFFIKLFNCKEIDEEKTLALVRSNDPESQLFGIEILKNKYLVK